MPKKTKNKLIGSKDCGSDSLQVKFKKNSDQHSDYYEKMYAASQVLATLMKKKRRTFNYAWKFLAKKRREIAATQEQNVDQVFLKLYKSCHDHFGKRRNEPLVTWYKIGIDHRIKSRIYKEIKETFKNISLRTFDNGFKYSVGEGKRASYHKLVQVEKLPTSRRNIELTATVFIKSKDPKDKEVKWVIIHTAPENIKKVLSYVRTIFARLTDTKRKYTKTGLIRDVAEMHWWLINAMPCFRGTAGISDALTKAIFTLRGYGVSRWRSSGKFPQIGVCPQIGSSVDVVALTSGLKEFRSNYIRFFE